MGLSDTRQSDKAPIGSTDVDGTPIVILRWPKSVPQTEYCKVFLQGMLDRVAQAFFKYGAMADAYPDRVDAVASLRKRINNYAGDPTVKGDTGDGNTEWLVDGGNFLMIEFKHPRHPKAHYRPTSTEESPGRAWHGEIDPTQRKNAEF